jgi:hypothetical protein
MCFLFQTLQAAEIDIKVFKAHSTRATAAFKALDKEASVDSIMRAECWKSKEVFNSFYNQANFLNIANL